MRKRMRQKLQRLKEELRRRMHDPLPEVGKWLRSVVTGHYRYYGVPRNGPALNEFRIGLMRLWKHILDRRSQTSRINWERMQRLAQKWLPLARICHPYPNQRLVVRL